jgi:hypothetical protein
MLARLSLLNLVKLPRSRLLARLEFPELLNEQYNRKELHEKLCSLAATLHTDLMARTD